MLCTGSVSIDNISFNRQAKDSSRTVYISSWYIFDWPSVEKKTKVHIVHRHQRQYREYY